MKDFEKIEERHKELIDIAIQKMKMIDDPKHSISHVLDVVGYTKKILEKFEANDEVCIISAYWHDVRKA